MRPPFNLLVFVGIVRSLQVIFSMTQVVAFQCTSRMNLSRFLSSRTFIAVHSSFGQGGRSLLASQYRQANRHDCQYYHSTTSILLSAQKSNSGQDNNMKEPDRRKQPKSRKIKLGDPSKVNLDALTAAFDEMARKEGFDESTAFYADDSTFEDDFAFDEEEFLDEKDLEMDMNDDNDNGDEDGMSMDDRIASAQRDVQLGRVSVPDSLSNFSREVSMEDLKSLGFRPELNPFGNDETPRREQFKLITDARKCSACGAKFQCRDEMKPGYLPEQKFSVQMKLAKIEDAQKLKEKAESNEWSPEDEVEWLLQSGGGGAGSSVGHEEDDIDIEQMADDMGIDLIELTKKKVICKRCHGLQNFGEAPALLRPGWTDEPSLSQEKFRDLLKPLRSKPAVIVALVDLFDFSGSILPELDSIAGDNPVIVAANKADLLPSKMGQTRAESWVRRELEYLGVKSIANIGGAVRLVSCKTGMGIDQMLGKARSLAEEMECDIYVVGAANAGKSTLINYILEKNSVKKSNEERGKKRAGNANKIKGAVTASPLPGTTLEFIKIDMGDGLELYDTPGLLVPGTLTQRLTPAELKMVIPKKQVEPVTFRVGSGKCVLIGGLAKIEVIGDSKPFFFTFFVSNDIKLHPTDSSKADEFIEKHAGTLLTPPLEPGLERIKEIGEFEHHDIEIDGMGWKEAAADISLRGLGWIAVTGAGVAQVRISLPKGIGFAVRPPLMPFDVWEATAKYTGGRAVRKSSKTKSGKRNSGVGRR